LPQLPLESAVFLFAAITRRSSNTGELANVPESPARKSSGASLRASRSPKAWDSRANFGRGSSCCGLGTEILQRSQRGRNYQARSPESLSNFRSFLVFLRLSSSSHLTGAISPLELHHLVPVHIPNLLVPSASQTRTAFLTFGFGSSTACGGMFVSFIRGAKGETQGRVKRSCLGLKGEFRLWEN
jgi:hypothetical protein